MHFTPAPPLVHTPFEHMPLVQSLPAMQGQPVSHLQLPPAHNCPAGQSAFGPLHTHTCAPLQCPARGFVQSPSAVQTQTLLLLQLPPSPTLVHCVSPDEPLAQAPQVKLPLQTGLAVGHKSPPSALLQAAQLPFAHTLLVHCTSALHEPLAFFMVHDAVPGFAQ